MQQRQLRLAGFAIGCGLLIPILLFPIGCAFAVRWFLSALNVDRELAALIVLATLFISVFTIVGGLAWLPSPGGRLVDSGRSEQEKRNMIHQTSLGMAFMDIFLGFMIVWVAKPFPATLVVTVLLPVYGFLFGRAVGWRCANVR